MSHLGHALLPFATDRRPPQRTRFRRTIAVGWSGLLAGWSLWLAASSAAVAAENRSTAFVAGFERFARHDEISDEAAGRLLISELGCTACHASPAADLAAKPAPDLNGLADRISLEWVTEYLVDPTATHPGATMPDRLSGRSAVERRQIATELTQFLGTFRRSLPEIRGTGANPVPHEFWNRGDADNGRVLFHRVGCVACHAPDPDHELSEQPSSPTDRLLELLDPEELAELGLASAGRPAPIQPLGRLAKKYSRRSLAHFLLNPAVTRAGERMPNLKLAVFEAADIAAYLMRRDAAETPPPSEFPDQPSTADARAESVALIEAGRKRFIELDCARCHSLPGIESDERSSATFKPLARLNRQSTQNCLAVADEAAADQASDSLPRYRLDAAQRTAIAAALDSIARPIDEGESLRAALLRHQCYACHQRDSLGGVGRDRAAYFETVGNEDLGDEGRLPPPLTSVEYKLKPGWLVRVLQGNGDVRPHLRARMPKWEAAHAKSIAAKFAEASRRPAEFVSPENASWPDAADVKRVDVGRQLMDMGCVQCHPFRGEALPGVIGVDLVSIADRVEPQWFRAFLNNPTTIKPRTRMPTFFPDGQSQHPELLGGVPDRQIAAMWGYLRDLPKQPLPAKIEQARGEDFELQPSDRPILLRTFMREAGPHAIAVGFPQATHFAFDADGVRLATAWTGRFLDAQGTWFIRSAPPADPLGERVIDFPKGDPFMVTDAIPGAEKNAADAAVDEPVGDRARFLGFRLDADGVPTFAYRIGGWQIEDRITPPNDGSAAAGKLVRKLRLRPVATDGGSTAAVRFRLHAGAELEPIVADQPESDGGYRAMKSESGLTVAVTDSLAAAATLESVDGGMVWWLPLRSDLGGTNGAKAAEGTSGVGDTSTAVGDHEHEIIWELRYAW